MIVLHYIPSLAKDNEQAARSVQMLHASMAKTIETHLCTGELSRREYLRILTTINPDIVHLHGCWNIYISHVRRWTARRGYPVMLSPYGLLSTKRIKSDLWKTYLPKILAYQFRLTRRVMLLHASSPEELQSLKQLGWKKRIAYINMSGSSIDDAQLSMQFRQLYQKAIDTYSRNKLDTLEEKWFWHLICTAVCKDMHEADSPPHMPLPHHSWRTLQIYAIDHGVTDLFLHGAERLSLNIPEKISVAPSRFSAKCKTKTYSEQMHDKKLQLQYVNNNEEYTLAQQFSILNLQLCHSYSHPEWDAPIRILADIFVILRYADIDENILAKILDDMKLTKFSARIIHILSEYFRLTIGFMPITPLNDSETHKIRTKINNLITTP